MDHPVFLTYASANGVPQESKLATYMVINVDYFIGLDTYRLFCIEPPKYKHTSGFK